MKLHSLLGPAIVFLGFNEALAKEPPLPKTVQQPPQTAYARISPEGDLEIYLVNTIKKTVMEKYTSYEQVTKIVDGKETIAKVPVAKMAPKEVMELGGWRKHSIKFTSPMPQVAFDKNGDPLRPEELKQRLDKETPVLVSASKLDPFYLLTAKDDVLVLLVPYQVLNPTLPGPSGVLPPIAPAAARPGNRKPN